MITDGLIWLSKQAGFAILNSIIWTTQNIVQPALPYLLTIIALILVRLLWILPYFHAARTSSSRSSTKSSQARIGVVLGSGGHTSEMLLLLSHLDSENKQYTYFISSGDTYSQSKLPSGTTDKIVIPRARNVHQSIWTTPFTLLYSLVYSLSYWQLFTRLDLLIMNGPATCIPIVLTVYVNRILGIKSPQLLYVESFARVTSLSLTARILQYFVDRFVVQWPLSRCQSHIECKGWLV